MANTKTKIPPTHSTMLDANEDRAYLEKVISELISYPTADKSEEDYRNGKLKDGTLFLVTEQEKHWICAVWVKGKLPFVHYDQLLYSPSRFAVLKRKGVARLLEISQTGWIPTAKMSYLPQRFEHVESGKVLFTSGTIKGSDLDEARDESPVIDPNYDPDLDIVSEKEHGNEAVKDVEVKEVTPLEEIAPLAPTE
jgi:hypothetical protein